MKHVEILFFVSLRLLCTGMDDENWELPICARYWLTKVEDTTVTSSAASAADIK